MSSLDSDTRLRVWHEDRLVGRLWRNGANEIGFQYCAEWLNSDNKFAVSASLPLSREPCQPEDALAHRFFANLLPEGVAREHIVRDLKITNSDFVLLQAIGGECAGTLSILPEDREPASPVWPEAYWELTDAGLQDLVLRNGRIYGNSQVSAAAQQFPRLSLAGAQGKCPVFFHEERIFLPRGEAPTSHILKFAMPGYRHRPAYEALLTDLARRVSLSVASVEFRRINARGRPHDYLVIERYDREITSNGARRLRQEDFCQALGLSRERKREEDDGVSFARCYRLLCEASSEPALDATQLLRWLIFNYLAGNSDGCAKNLSLLYHPGRAVRLAPFYGLACAQALDKVDPRLAFAVGGERRPGNIGAAQWRQQAVALGIKPGYLRTLLDEMTKRIQQELKPAVEAFQEQHGAYPPLQRVAQLVQRQCRHWERERRKPAA